MALEVTEAAGKGINGPTRVPKQELGKDDFLLLLTKQLQNQDPLKPMDNTAFISQMANFSSLEQMTNMNANLEKFTSYAAQNYKTEGIGFLGKEVAAQVQDSVDPVVGRVDAVRFQDGHAIFRVGDYEILLDDILSVDEPAAAT